MAEMVMPRLSDTMEEGTILRWLKRDGEHVRRGEELVEIETDKANMTYESDQEGVLRIVAAEGESRAIGELIAHVGEDVGGEGPPEAEGAGAAPPAAEGRPAEPAQTSPAGEAPSREPSPVAADGATAAHDGERVRASPVARRIASESGVDLAALTGSGPGGRIVKADVEAAAAKGDMTRRAPTGTTPPPTGGAPAQAPTPSGPPPQPPALAGVATAKGETTTHELSRTQQAIARRMAESKATIPDFDVRMEVEMERCVALRDELKRLAEPAPPTYNDMIVKACALALREHPRVNGSYRDARLHVHSRVNVGVAVATEEALVVPTVFDADAKSLGEIARETRALAERVRDGSITPPELGGGTFTVSNLGMYGVESFTAIVNPPQAAILSVGALGPRAVVRDGEVVARAMVTVALACDHRILYGADAARFLGRVRELLEQPSALTL
jgi:pyruvate dehydrogenase E2 component (dihydrolipoamide acetyltransferase)